MTATKLAEEISFALQSNDPHEIAWGQRALATMADILDRRLTTDALHRVEAEEETMRPLAGATTQPTGRTLHAPGVSAEVDTIGPRRLRSDAALSDPTYEDPNTTDHSRSRGQWARGRSG